VVVSREAGGIVESDCRISVNNARAAEALTLAASWVGTIAPRGVLNYAEEEARGVFQSGNAVFMRNWPYTWPLVNAASSPVRGKVRVTVLPKGGPEGRHAAALGGGQLAVSRYSRSPDAAIGLVRYLTGRAEQKRRAITGGFNPTIEALYRDPEVLVANPFFRELYDTFVQAVARPSGVTGVHYRQVSAEFWNTVQTVLSGRGDARSELGRLERTLGRIMRTPAAGVACPSGTAYPPAGR
jgi:trehalose/maltose transport system substrate-binding protein